MLLRKLIVLAITSGLAKKAYDRYRARKALAAPLPDRPQSLTQPRPFPAATPKDF
jgi:hypothetical protein